MADNTETRICGKAKCKAVLPPDYTLATCQKCRDQHREYQRNRRAREKAEKEKSKEMKMERERETDSASSPNTDTTGTPD